jgi:DNA-binding NtrC family response regulator
MTTYGSFSSGFPVAGFRVSRPVSDTAGDAPLLIGESAAMRRLRLQIERIGPHFRTVLIRGEIGSGKELAARALHAKSTRAAEPLKVCHAARLNEMEHERPGDPVLFTEIGRDGTSFLDGVDEMSAEGQKRLLAMLDQKTSPRMIAATSQDLRVMAAAGLFRQDLYQRLAMVEISLEPLRRRTEDIPALALHFLERFSSRYGKRVDAIAHEAMQLLLDNEWPGNVRELENVVHNAVLQCESAVVEVRDLSTLTHTAKTTGAVEVMRPAEATLKLQEVIDRHVVRVLRECAGNKVRAAEVLGISRSTLYRMLEGRVGEAAAPQL